MVFAKTALQWVRILVAEVDPDNVENDIWWWQFMHMLCYSHILYCLSYVMQILGDCCTCRWLLDVHIRKQWCIDEESFKYYLAQRKVKMQFSIKNIIFENNKRILLWPYDYFTFTCNACAKTSAMYLNKQ